VHKLIDNYYNLQTQKYGFGFARPMLAYFQSSNQGRFYDGAGGTCPPDSLVVPPDSKASWPFWRDFWGPKMFQNPNFPWLHPGPRWESLQRSLPPSRQEPHPALGPSSLVSTGLKAQPTTELATVLMINFRYRPIWSSYFSGFGERRKCTRLWMGWWAMPPPQNFLG